MERRKQEGRLRKARYYNGLAGILNELAAVETEKDVKTAMLRLARQYEEACEKLTSNVRIH